MRAVAAVEFTTAVQPEPVALAAVEMVAQLLAVTALRHLPTPAAAVAAHRQTHRLLTLAAMAALASFSSSTTSALPRSLPSSHRRIGLHQRVR
jgi:hypothetical protein